MRIVLLCATQRGYSFLETLFRVAQKAEIVVFSFKEEPHEPPFMGDIRALTEAKGGQFFETKNIGDARWQEFLGTNPIDLMLVVSWRFLVPRHVYSLARRGAFVFHDSKLPRYRGFSPTVWAIINGESETGATLFEMVEDVDSGRIVDQVGVPIGPDDTIDEVTKRVTEAYLRLLQDNFDQLTDGTISLLPQDHSAATYTCKRLPQDNRIDWSQPATRIHDLVRAVNVPYPGAFTFIGNKKLTIWSAQRLPDYRCFVGRVPGRVVEIRQDGGVVVLTGNGVLLILRVQIEGEPVVNANKVLNKLSLTMGDK